AVPSPSPLSSAPSSSGVMPGIRHLHAQTFVERERGTRLGDELGLRVLHDLALLLLRDELDSAVPGGGRRYHDLLLRQADAAELDRKPLQGTRVAAAFLDRGARNLGHAPEA